MKMAISVTGINIRPRISCNHANVGQNGVAGGTGMSLTKFKGDPFLGCGVSIGSDRLAWALSQKEIAFFSLALSDLDK